MAEQWGKVKWGEKQWGAEGVAPDFISNILELEVSTYRKPYVQLLIAWGGNWTRARNVAGTLLTSITSSGEDGSGDYPDDRAMDEIRPHKDPVDSGWYGWWQSAVKPSVTPQWLRLDFSTARIVNRIILYHYYDAPYVLRDFKIQSSDDGTTWSTRTIIVNNQDNKTIIDYSTAITARYWRLYIEACYTDVVARVQEIEFYHFSDESSRMTPTAAPEYSVELKISDDANSLPEPTEFMFVLDNTDERYSPYNEDSAIYGTKQIDGVGFIRAGTPVIIKGGFYNAAGALGLVEVLSGQIGSDDNPQASTGITIDTDSDTVTLLGKDFTNRMTLTKIPSQLPVYLNYSIEDLIRELGYLANIPYQDMQLEASGITINYAIFAQTSVADELEKLRESMAGKLFTSFNETLKFISTNPYRSWTQSEMSEFEAGIYSTDCFDTTTEPGKLVAKIIDTQPNWETAGTRTDIDTTTKPGSILISDGFYENNKTGSAMRIPFFIGGAAWRTKLAMPFTPSTNRKIYGFSILVAYSKSGTGSNVTYEIITDNAGDPTGAILFSETRTPAEIPYGTEAWDTHTPAYIQLTGGQKYWIVITSVNAGGNETFVDWAYNGADGSKYWNSLGSWNVQGANFGYRLYTIIDVGILITATINLGTIRHTAGKIGIACSIPANTEVEVYSETKAADAGWGTQVLKGTATAGATTYQCPVGTLLQYIRIQLKLKRIGNTVETPEVMKLGWPIVWVSVEKDLTVNILSFGIFSANIEYDQGDITYKAFTYPVSATSWDDALAVAMTNGGQNPAIVKRYILISIEMNPTFLLGTPKLLDFTANWLVTSGQTRNYIFQCDFTGNNKRIKALPIYDLGNPKCNNAIVKINPFIAQALATLWTYDETPIIANGATLEIFAEYSYPSIKSSGGNLRHAHLTLSATAGTCNDGSTAVINGCNISFYSGANIGIITIVNNSGGSRSLDVCNIDAIQLWTAEYAKRKTRAESQDTTSIALYGNKGFTIEIDNPFIPTLAIAQNLADTLVDNGKYSKGHISGLIIPFAPNITLQDIISITHPDIKTIKKQTIPIAIAHSGLETTLQCEET